FLIFFLLFTFACFAQNPIVLVNSDSIVGYKINESPVRDFIGNVHLRQGNIDIYCNKATHFLEENRAILVGAVRIIQDTLVLVSDYIEYDGNKSIANSSSKVEIKDPQNLLRANYGTYNFKNKIANFFESVYYEEKNAKLTAKKADFDRVNNIVYAYQNVKLESDSLILSCDTLIYSKPLNTLSALSNVETKAKYESLEILSGKMFIDRKNKFSKSYENPILMLVDTVKIEEDTIGFRLDTLFLFADTLYSNSNDTTSILRFIHNVRLFKGELVTIGEYGELYRQDEWGYLVGSPYLWYDSTELKGDSLYFLMRDKKISFVEFVGNSSILSPSNLDTLYVNRIQCDTLKIYFQNNKIDHILGIGKALTNYFLRNEETGEIQLANYISEKVVINFIDNEVDKVVWLGNVDGEVIPKIIFDKNLEKYYSLPKNFLIKKPTLHKKL
ncbi:MAG: OstA-like protein, partial [Candidatus Kapaibacteriota bacterium]